MLWPTHGNPITETQPYPVAYLAHRVEREEQVLAQLRGGATTIEAMVAVLYADVRTELPKAAGRSVFADLVKLVDDGLVTAVGDGPRPTLQSEFHSV